MQMQPLSACFHFPVHPHVHSGQSKSQSAYLFKESRRLPLESSMANPFPEVFALNRQVLCPRGIVKMSRMFAEREQGDATLALLRAGVAEDAFSIVVGCNSEIDVSAVPNSKTVRKERRRYRRYIMNAHPAIALIELLGVFVAYSMTCVILSSRRSSMIAAGIVAH
jgi:hypothetical protein